MTVQGQWLDACSRRIRELQPDLSNTQADQTAIRLWYQDGSPTYRAMHPVAAAESWHRRSRLQRPKP